MADSAIRLIQRTVLNTNTSTITFSSIPNTYKDLFMIVSASPTGSGNSIIRLNGSSSSSYHILTISVSTTTATGNNASNQSGAFLETGSTPFISKIDFIDYTNTSAHKGFLIRESSSQDGVQIRGCRWADTSVISSIEISGHTFATGSLFALYGVIG